MKAYIRMQATLAGAAKTSAADWSGHLGCDATNFVSDAGQ